MRRGHVFVFPREQQPVETVINSSTHGGNGGMPDEFKEADWRTRSLDRLADILGRSCLFVDH